MLIRLLALIVLLPAVACAADVTPTGFSVRHELTISAPVAKVYDTLTQVSAWWNPEHTYSGDSKNLSIDARPGGCFCERLPDGGVEHMRVVLVKRNQLLRLHGGLGPLQGSGLAGTLTWRLTPADAGTKLDLTYNVGGFMAGGFEAVAPAVERVLGEQIARLKRAAESATP